MPILSADAVTAGYGGAPIVQEVSVQAEQGHVVALVGPNGAGKSTLLKALFGLIPKSGGVVELDGKAITSLRPHVIARTGMAYVPQVDNVFPSLSVSENLEMGAYVTKGDVGHRVNEILDIFPDLAKARGAKAGNLSGGQKNMLAMARALMLKPHVVLLDEPTAGLSPTYTQIVWQQVRRIADTGAAVLVVEQNVDLAIVHSDYVYVLVAGRNRLQGQASDIQRINLGAIFLGHEEQPGNQTDTQKEMASDWSE